MNEIYNTLEEQWQATNAQYQEAVKEHEGGNIMSMDVVRLEAELLELETLMYSLL